MTRMIAAAAKFEKKTFLLAVAVAVVTILPPSSKAFSVLPPTPSSARTTTLKTTTIEGIGGARGLNRQRPSVASPFPPLSRRVLLNNNKSRLSMYNLPSGGGGGGGNNNNNNKIADAAKSVFGIVLFAAFFASPLGGFVLGLFNSFLLLLFFLPLAATAGFQIWQSLNTVQGPCPNCGSPATVMKSSKNDGGVVGGVAAQQSICFGCGSILQANEDNTGIDNVSGRTTVDDLSSRGGFGNGNSIFDVFSSSSSSSSSGERVSNTAGTSSAKTTTTVDKSSVIDVDVVEKEEDPKPFQ